MHQVQKVITSCIILSQRVLWYVYENVHHLLLFSQFGPCRVVFNVVRQICSLTANP